MRRSPENPKRSRKKEVEASRPCPVHWRSASETVNALNALYSYAGRNRSLGNFTTDAWSSTEKITRKLVLYVGIYLTLND
jgi:hypothetical protein